MTWLLVAAGAAVAFGAAVAVGAGGARTAGLGALVALVFSPFVADPLPPAPVLGFRIVAGVLAGFLLYVAARRAGPASGSPIGLPATVAAAIAAFVAGLGATAVGLPSFGPEAALAKDAGLATGPRGGILVDSKFRTQDPRIFAMSAAVLGLASLAAALVPAWRVSRIDPIRALRNE